MKEQLDAMPGIREASVFGYREGPRPEHEWHPPNLDGEYFWDPMTVIEQTTIPVLAFFGGKDTQADPVQGAQAYRQVRETNSAITAHVAEHITGVRVVQAFGAEQRGLDELEKRQGLYRAAVMRGARIAAAYILSLTVSFHGVLMLLLFSLL